MMRLCRLLPVAALVASAPAYGASAAEAEYVRLAEETRRLASRNAWRGVEASYLKMLELEKKGVKLAAEDHMFGVQAATQLGSIYDVYTRLLAANAVELNPDRTGQIKAIEATYGRVDLDVNDKFEGEFALKPATMPFDPTQRKSIELAQRLVTQERKFNGMLPQGNYTLGDTAFTVTANSPEPAHVYLAPAKRGGKKGGGDGKVAVRERTGLRVDLGPQWSTMGAAEITTEGSSTVSSASEAAMGGRLGVGYELFLTDGWCLALQGGWHGGFAGSVEGNTDAFAGPVREESSLGLQSFYGWVAPTWYRDDLAVTFGPTYSYVIVNAPAEDPALGSLNGRLTAGGGALSIFYGLFDTPGLANSRSGLSVAGGVFASRSMSFPWAQVAFTVAPEG